MVRQVFAYIFFSIMSCMPSFTQANPAPFSLELHNAYLPDAIAIIAKFLRLNVIISPSIQGTITLTLSNATPTDALDLLLVSQGLAKWQKGHVLLIAPQEELIKRKQEEQSWQTLKDDTAPLLTQLWEIKYAKAEEIVRLLQDEHVSLLSKRGYVRADGRTNTIAIQDSVERIQMIRKWMDRLDVPVQQILIEARLASVDYDFEQELGIQFGVRQDSVENHEKTLSSMLPQAKVYSLAVATLADGSLLDVKLSALESSGHAELISSPSLYTANQQSASIEAGEEVPYQQVTESGGTAVTFKKAVLGLKVTPQVLPGDQILLQLQINQDRPSNKMVLGMPTISTRQIITNVLVQNGETIVLGGIYETNKENGEQGLPFIHRIPLIGLLFTQQSQRQSKRELLIFVTPKIDLPAGER